MEHAERGVGDRELHDRRLERHPEDAAGEGLLDRFAAPGHLVRDQHGGRGGDHIHDADERSSRGDERVRANSRAPTAVAKRAKTYAHVESASTWISNAESPPRAAICARERSTKITSRAITWSPK